MSMECLKLPHVPSFENTTFNTSNMFILKGSTLFRIRHWNKTKIQKSALIVRVPLDEFSQSKYPCVTSVQIKKEKPPSCPPAQSHAPKGNHSLTFIILDWFCLF